jgi:hypothetical protein
VITPSFIPKKPGERIKTDKRDALNGEMSKVGAVNQQVNNPRNQHDNRRHYF